MFRSHCLILLLVCVLANSVFGANTKMITGTAFDSDFKTIIYHENHRFSQNNKIGIVNYYGKSKTLIANKNLYFNDPYCPSFQLLTNQNEFLYGIIKNNKKYYYKNGTHKEEANILNDKPDLPVICDGGFDFYMKDLVIKNSNAETTSIIFGFPKKTTSITMKVIELTKKSIPKKINLKLTSTYTDNDSYRYFRVRPANWLINKLAEPIYLIYKKNGELLLFSGPSNLPMYDHLDRVNILYEH